MVFGFWRMHKYPMELTNEIVYQVCRDNHLFDRRIFIINGGKPLIEYNSFMPCDDEIEDNTEQAILHMLPGSKKWKETAGFRNIRDKQLGKKLTMSNGKEMPMAQYNALRYVDESGNIVSQSRFASLFNIRRATLNEHYNSVVKNKKDYKTYYHEIERKLFLEDFNI